MSYPDVQLTLLAVADMIDLSFNLTISENVQTYILLKIGQRGIQTDERLVLQSYTNHLLNLFEIAGPCCLEWKLMSV